MVQRRSTFLLAQANEALGEFDLAKGHYESLLKDAPECPFAAASQRGVERCGSKDLAMVYESFRDFEEAAEVAPGPLVPDAPKLNIDELKLPEGEPDTFDAGGGDFGGDEMKKEEKTEEASAGSGTVTEKAVSEPEAPTATETPVETEKKVETPETPVVEVKPVAEPATETPVEPSVEAVPVEPATEVPSTPVVEPMPEVAPTNPAAPQVPSEVIPTEVPSDVVPSDVVPSEVVPTEVVPTEVPTGVAPVTPAVEVPAGGE